MRRKWNFARRLNKTIFLTRSTIKRMKRITTTTAAADEGERDGERRAQVQRRIEHEEYVQTHK